MLMGYDFFTFFFFYVPSPTSFFLPHAPAHAIQGSNIIKGFLFFFFTGKINFLTDPTQSFSLLFWWKRLLPQCSKTLSAQHDLWEGTWERLAGQPAPQKTPKLMKPT